MKIDDFDIYLFDCDGVILNSNEIKSEAFYDLAEPYGQEIAESFVSYHKKNGGVSRFVKCEYLSQLISHSQSSDELTEKFGEIVFKKLLNSDFVDGVLDFLKLIEKKEKHVVSGSLENELISIFESKQIKDHFKSINGSPRTKAEIVTQMKILAPERVLFIGDSLLDYEVAKQNNFNFLFISAATEFKEWKEFFIDKKVLQSNDFIDFIHQIDWDEKD